MVTHIEQVDKLLREFIANLKNAAAIAKREDEDAIATFACPWNVSREAALAIAKKANGVAQARRGKNGTNFQSSICDLLDAIAGRPITQRHWKMPGYRARPFDGYIGTPGVDWLFTVKTTPRERAEHTWNEEFASAKHYTKQHGTDLRFIALTEAPLIPSLRAKLHRSIDYGSAKDHDFMSRVARELAEALE